MSRRFASIEGGDAQLKTLWRFLAFLWPKENGRIRFQVSFACLCLFASKLAQVTVPFIYKDIIDYFNPKLTNPIVIPILLISIYALVRLSSSLFSELRDITFSYVREAITRTIGISVFQHLHRLSLGFHLDRKTGALSRSIERGINAIEMLLFFSTFNILPTLVEILLVSAIVSVFFGFSIALTIVVPLVFYIIFSVVVTEWRNKIQRELNKTESEASAHAIDSLLNYETVKYFSNEKAEEKRYDHFLEKHQKIALKSQKGLSFLNFGQQFIIVVGLFASMILASQKLLADDISLGDFVLINTYLFQLYIPLNMLGMAYRTIKQSLVDIEAMVSLLAIKEDIKDLENAPDLNLSGGEIRFEDVSFHYDTRRPILKHVSFTVPRGKTIALVGPSGAGKSTISRLLFRFYDPVLGRILIDDQDIRKINQHSLRKAIGIVPQDCVLFNDTLFFNIAYGNLEASKEDVYKAAEQAHISAFIEELPQKYDTIVGERGLKLSGGEKQRIAIARVLLKKPIVFMFDEATSALDSQTEKEIQKNLREISANATTLIIAHRLSTIIDADQILVLEKGQIKERGTHEELLELQGLYAKMWSKQLDHGRN